MSSPDPDRETLTHTTDDALTTSRQVWIAEQAKKEEVRRAEERKSMPLPDDRPKSLPVGPSARRATEGALPWPRWRSTKQRSRWWSTKPRP